jgi:hypothetical protein
MADTRGSRSLIVRGDASCGVRPPEEGFKR